MLHMISWKEYFTLMGLLVVLYYGWLLVRYYPGLKIGRKGKADRGRQVLPDFVKLKAAGGTGVAAGAGEVIGKPDQAMPAGKQGTQLELPMSASAVAGKAGPLEVGKENGAPLQAEIAKEEGLPISAVMERPLLLVELAEALTNEVYRLVEKEREGAMAQPELLYAVELLLGRPPYNQLKGTFFEGKMSAQIVRDLERHGSIHLDAEVVKGWWK